MPHGSGGTHGANKHEPGDMSHFSWQHFWCISTVLWLHVQAQVQTEIRALVQAEVQALAQAQAACLTRVDANMEQTNMKRANFCI